MKKLILIILSVSCINTFAITSKNYWHVKCFQNGQTINVMAMAQNGHTLPVMAYRTGNVLAVRAFEGKKNIPIKIIKGESQSFYDVRAIKNGRIIPI